MPINEEAEPLRIIQITDLHLQARPEEGLGWCPHCHDLDTTETLCTVLDDIQVNEPCFDALVVTGDIAQDGEAEAYVQFDRLLRGEGSPVYCLPGNHDDRQALHSALDGDVVSMPRYIVKKDWLLLFLDTSKRGVNQGEITTIQLGWIKAMVEKFPQHHAALFIHHHPVPVGSEWLDTHHGMINSAAALAQLSSLPQLKTIVCGHIHQQLDHQYENIRILGTPSTCLQFLPNSKHISFTAQTPAYRRLTLHRDGYIETEVVFSHQPWLAARLRRKHGFRELPPQAV